MATSGRSLGVLTIDLVANIGGFVEGMTQAERETEKLDRAQKRQYESLQRLIGAIDPVVGGLNKLADQQRKLQAVFDKGLIDKQVFDQLTARIAENRAEIEKSTPAYKALLAAQEDITRAQQAMGAAGYNLTQSLKAEVANFGLSTDALRRREAALLGVSATVEPLINQLARLRQEEQNLATLERNRATFAEERIRQIDRERAQTEQLNQARIATARENATAAFTGGGPVYSRANMSEASQVQEVVRAREQVANLRRADLIATNESILRLERLAAVEKRIADTKAKNAADAAAAQARTANNDAFLRGLERQVALYGKATSEIVAYDAAQRGLTAQAAPLVARLKETEKQFTRSGLSAKQMQLAVAGLPAQFSDIFVSLQGGQAPLTVFLQQGLQIRDMFGSASAAAKAFGAQLLALARNPYILAAAALTGLGLAAKSFLDSQREITAAVLKNGQAAGFTSRQLSAMIDNLGAARNNFSGAAEALNTLAAAGLATGDNLRRLGDVTLTLAKLTGKNAKEATQAVIALFDGTAEGAVKANKEYNFLTTAMIEQIIQLEKQGDTYGILKLQSEAFLDSVNPRIDEQKSRLTALGEAYEYVKKKVGELVNESKKAAGGLFARPDSGFVLENGRLRSTAEIAQENSQLAAATRLTSELAVSIDRQTESLKKQIATKEGGRLAEVKYERAQKLAAAGNLQGAEAQKKAIEDITRLYAPLLDAAAKYDKLTAKKPKEPKEFRDDAATVRLASLKQQEAALRAQTGLEDKLTAGRRALIQFEQEIADLKEKKQLTADQKSLLAAEDQLRVRYQTIAAIEDQNRAQAELLKGALKLEQIQRGLADELQLDQEAANQQVFGLDLGDREREQQAKRLAVQVDYAKRRSKLERDFLDKDNVLNAAQQQLALDALDSAENAKLARLDETNKRILEQQKDITVGFRRAFANMAEDAENFASIGEEAARSVQDAFADFLFDPFSNGLKGMVRDFAAAMQRIAAEAASKQILGSIFGNIGAGGPGGFLEGLLSLGGGLGGSTPISAPPGRAIGGIVDHGKPYTVGERGREIFVPKTAGTIIPNDKLGGRSTSVNNYFTINTGGAPLSKATQMQIGAAAARGAARASGRNN